MNLPAAAEAGALAEPLSRPCWAASLVVLPRCCPDGFPGNTELVGSSNSLIMLMFW